MIRQIRRLTHAVPALGPVVSAIAIYSEATPRGMKDRCAAESGFEGVACVDDTARLASLYIAHWRTSGEPHWRTAALRALAFVKAMQTRDGWFVNFISRWDGTKNMTGRTSADPLGPWLARACHALAEGAAAFGDKDCASAFERALPWLDEPTPYLDLRAVALLAVLEFAGARREPGMDERASRLAAEIHASRVRATLPDARSTSTIHLWGHLQECALAKAGTHFGNPQWVEAARASAERLLIPAVAHRFPGRTSIAFDVSCTVRGLDAVATATGEARYANYAALARAWFDGRNAAGMPVFDRARGLVYDGIDDGRVSPNSGAESNIEAGLALVTDPRRRTPAPRRPVRLRSRSPHVASRELTPQSWPARDKGDRKPAGLDGAAYTAAGATAG